MPRNLYPSSGPRAAFSKRSLPELKATLADMRERLQTLFQEVERLTQSLPSVQEAVFQHRKLSILAKELQAKLQKCRPLFGLWCLSREKRAEYEDLQNKCECAYQEMAKLAEKYPSDLASTVYLPGIQSFGEVAKLRTEIILESKTSAHNELAVKVARLEKIVAQKEGSLQKKAQVRAMASAYMDKSREAANAVKAKLKIQKEQFKSCPYCNGQLGDEPHCDHIIPIAMGGLSIDHNMVFICSDCNLRKGAKTLREFVVAVGFDREEIEKRLLVLGKRI